MYKAQRSKSRVEPVILSVSCFLYLLFTPIYLFEPGTPQPADLFLVLSFVAINLIRPSLNLKNVIPVVLLFAWVAFVNLSWSLLEQDARIMFNTLFYVNSLLVIAMFIRLYRYPGFGEVIFWGFFSAMSIQLILLFLGASVFSGTRMSGTFNNPNQLGYFAVLAASFSVFLKDFKRAALFVLALIVACMSLSKAAIAAVIFASIYFFSLNWKNFIYLPVALIVLSSVYFNTDLYTSVEARFINMDTDDSLEGRGYDRIVEFPHLTILGAGEIGSHARFYEGKQRDKEFHSSFGTLFFSYGVVGITIFGFILLRATPMNREMFLLGAPFVYGLAHNGLRWPLIWVLVALFMIKKVQDRNDKLLQRNNPNQG